MALNILHNGIKRLRTHLPFSSLPQASPVREEDASSCFFSNEYTVSRDLAQFILDRVDDKALARMQRLNRKWYWTIVKCPRLMERLSINSFISSCIHAGKAEIKKLRQDMRQLGCFAIPSARSLGLLQIAQATLAIARVDPQYLEIAKVAAFELEEPLHLAYAIKNVAEEEALTDINAANSTALKIKDPRVQDVALRGIAEVEVLGRNKGIKAVGLALKGEPLIDQPVVPQGLVISDNR